MIDAATLERLLAEPESPTLEFKLQVSLVGPARDRLRDELAKYVIALSNSGLLNGRVSAYLIIGAGDHRNADSLNDRHLPVIYTLDHLCHHPFRPSP